MLAALLPLASLGQIVEDWGEVRLRAHGQELTPLAVPDPPLWGKRFAEGWLDLLKENSIQVRADTGEVLRTIVLSAGSKVAVTQDDRVLAAYLGKMPDGDPRLVGWISQPGKIGPGPLRILQAVGESRWELLGAAVVAGREGFLLGMPKKEDERGYERVLLKVFSGEDKLPLLSWEQPVNGGHVSLPGVFLWAQGRPNQATPGLLPLVACGDAFLVTPGPQDPIYCIDPAKPDKPLRWKLEKPWEFQRGFTGPSVWSHHFSRFGLDSFSRDGSEPIDWENFVDQATDGVTPDYKDEHRKKAEEQMARLKVVEADLSRRCQMAGGPFVVESENPMISTIFVAVMEAESAGAWASYLSHTIVYEIDAATGTPVAFIRLPRNTLGSMGRLQGGGVVWRCEENGIARLEPSRTAEFHFGPGGPDCIGKLKWYREEMPLRKDAWLSSPATGMAFAWTEAGMISALDDTWIGKEGDKQLHLPIREFGPAGEPSTYELIVPLKKPVKAPDSNYSSAGGKVRTSGPYVLGITGLELWDNRLYVTLGYEGGYRTLVFDGIGETMDAEKGGKEQSTVDPKPKSEGNE